MAFFEGRQGITFYYVEVSYLIQRVSNAVIYQNKKTDRYFSVSLFVVYLMFDS